MTKHVHVIEVFESPDDYDGGEPVLELYLDGQFIRRGDHYHDKFGTQVEGFELALETLGYAVTSTSERTAGMARYHRGPQ